MVAGRLLRDHDCPGRRPVGPRGLRQGHGGIVFGELAGQALTRASGYGPIFAVAGTLHVLAFILVAAVIRRVRPLHMASERA
jgi:hypothetical protein